MLTHFLTFFHVVLVLTGEAGTGVWDIIAGVWGAIIGKGPGLPNVNRAVTGNSLTLGLGLGVPVHISFGERLDQGYLDNAPLRQQ